ncbi:MAG: N-acetylmuramoyl-L-alanine amidase [Gammaproteobacteria bacterium]|nr:N-acetylmuramoyl-L-alanine amidase [Gammaproteobacteria bacterium]
MLRALAGLAVFMCSWAVLAAPVAIEGVRVAAQDGKTRVALDLNNRAEHRIFTLNNPYRVVIDVKGRVQRSALPLPSGKGVIRQVRAANRDDGTARIVLDVAGPVKPRSFQLEPNGKQGNRLVVDLLSAGTAYKPSSAKPPAPRAVSKPKPKPKPNSAPVRTARSSTLKGDRIVIAIDPGHGGKDPGAAGPTGVREKDVVLGISKELASLINADPMLEARLTRSSDRFVQLRSRMELARTAEADLFVSVHADAFKDRRVRGATVYVLNSKGQIDEASKRLANRENAALIGGVKLDDKDPMLASVLMDLSQNATLGNSFDVGAEVLSEIGQVTKVRKRTVQQAPFLVLKSPDVPSILIETAFISNPTDENNLASRRYREQLAGAIYEGIRDYFEANPPPDSMLAARIKNGQPMARTVEHRIKRGETLSGIADRYRVPVRRIRAENNLNGDKIVVGRVLRITAARDI